VKIEVNIPDSKYCNTCLFCYEKVDSFAYEDSHNHCAFLNKPLNSEVVSPVENRRIKKHPDCPSLERSK
jgi:hypothetical protein